MPRRDEIAPLMEELIPQKTAIMAQVLYNQQVEPYRRSGMYFGLTQPADSFLKVVDSFEQSNELSSDERKAIELLCGLLLLVFDEFDCAQAVVAKEILKEVARTLPIAHPLSTKLSIIISTLDMRR